MAQFRKKPVVIDAVQFDGTFGSVWPMIREHREIQWEPDGGVLTIKTLEGDMTASPSDWIIRGVKGEFYPCKPDIFAATYEAV
jgi:hypothetical protein